MYALLCDNRGTRFFAWQEAYLIERQKPQYRPPNNIAFRQDPPYSRIGTHEPVVSHDEIFVGTKCASDISERTRMNVRFIQYDAFWVFFVCYGDGVAFYCNCLARQTYESFNEIFRCIERVFKYKDVAALRIVKFIRKFINDQVLSIGECRIHRRSVYHKWLRDPYADWQYNNDRENYIRSKFFPERAFFNLRGDRLGWFHDSTVKWVQYRVKRPIDTIGMCVSWRYFVVKAAYLILFSL